MGADVSSVMAGVDEETLETEEKILKAAQYVRMAQAQRELVNRKIQIARDP